MPYFTHFKDFSPSILASLYVDDLQISFEGSDMRMIERQLQTAVNNIVKCKSTVAPFVFQRVFAYHRSQYNRYSAIYTDGSKREDYVGCGIVNEDFMHGYRLDTSCSVFTAEAVAIYRALQSIDSNMPRKYCIYTDSMSVLVALENYNDRFHPVVCKILVITSRLYGKGFAGYRVT
ncbi:pggt1b [Trichonephila clavipes]|nr:pggt1b [Trichonephila clavipes]